MIDSEFDSINVVPLVDVMLVLLTIVLMTSTFIATKALPVQLPTATQAATASLKSLTIEIDTNGEIYIDALKTSAVGLRHFLNNKNRETHIIIRADKNIHLQQFVTVLDTIQNMGFKKVLLQAETARS